MKSDRDDITIITSVSRSRKTFGRRLREVRQFWGMPQRRLAQLARTSQSQIAQIEAGRANPTVDLLERIASALQLDLHLTLNHRDHTKRR